jgi:hypothetical protein
MRSPEQNVFALQAFQVKNGMCRHVTQSKAPPPSLAHSDYGVHDLHIFFLPIRSANAIRVVPHMLGRNEKKH